MRKPQKFFAVRVTVASVNGDTHVREYVRGQRHIGKYRFICESIGDLLTLTGAGEDFGQEVLSRPIHWTVTELKQSEVSDDDYTVCTLCDPEGTCTCTGWEN